MGEVAAETLRALSAEIAIDEEMAACARWISTGAGASEGPARLFATLLRERGVLADYAPISSFVSGAPPGDACVVVSQCLSPNARVPLARASAYRRVVLVTTKDADVQSAKVVKHGPASEDGLLLRVVGPAAANATIISLASAIRRNGATTAAARVGAVLATSRERALRALGGIDPAALFEVAGLVASGADVAMLDGLRHKLLEAFGAAHPPVWDLCALVHGPLQSFYERRATLLLFEREGGRDGDLGVRLERVLSPERHRVVRITSSLPGPLALLDYDLQLDHLVLEALRARPRDLAQWPGKGHDAALYELGDERGGTGI